MSDSTAAIRSDGARARSPRSAASTGWLLSHITRHDQKIAPPQTASASPADTTARSRVEPAGTPLGDFGIRWPLASRAHTLILDRWSMVMMENSGIVFKNIPATRP